MKKYMNLSQDKSQKKNDHSDAVRCDGQSVLKDVFIKRQFEVFDYSDMLDRLDSAVSNSTVAAI